MSNFTVGDPDQDESGDGHKSSAAKDDLSFTCGRNEYQCTTSPYDDRTLSTSLPKISPRCIWSKLRCDYHQNCGLGHESDESGCGYFRRIGSYQERLSSWSVSTMSLLIIVYLAIVLILVLVTMLLLRWHKVLRTPLEVLSESRIHQTPPMVMEDTEISAPNNVNVANSTPATVSIMVMYRPHKPRNLTQPASVELPPSYESLFMSESPPSYTIAASDEATTENHDTTLPGQDSSVTSTTSETEVQEDTDHCQCDCDHSKCQNAS